MRDRGSSLPASPSAVFFVRNTFGNEGWLLVCHLMFYFSSVKFVDYFSVVLILMYLWVGAPIMDSFVVDIR